MKKAIILLFLMSFTGLLSAQKRPPAVWVYSVNMYTRTIAAVPCNEFMRAFQGHIDTTVCYSRDSLDAIDAFLKHVRYSKDSEDIDTRVKFEYLSSTGKVTNICMDIFGISLNGRMIEQYPEFYKYLQSLIPKRQLAPKGTKKPV
jgi:hypothetical protein